MADNYNDNYNDNVTIGFGKLSKYGIVSSCMVALQIFFTVAYRSIPNNLLNETISKTFLAYVINGWILIIPGLIDMLYVIKHYNVTMNAMYYNMTFPSNQYPLLYLKLLRIVDFVLMSYFMSYFDASDTPLKYGIYNNLPYMCFAMRIIIGYSFACWWIIIAMGFVAACMSCRDCASAIVSICHDCASLCFNSSENSSEHRNLIGDQNSPILRTLSRTLIRTNDSQIRRIPIQFFASYLPISLDPPLNKVCAICFEDAKKYDMWRKLLCGHRFHPACVDGWIVEHNTCPLCRAKIINDDDNANYHEDNIVFLDIV